MVLYNQKETLQRKWNKKDFYRLRLSRKGGTMSEYGGNNHCHECDGLHGNHYPGCIYEGSSGRAGCGGSDLGKAIFFFFVIIGVFVAALCPPIGALIIVLGAKITGV